MGLRQAPLLRPSRTVRLDTPPDLTLNLVSSRCCCFAALQHMTTELGKSCESGEAVLALKKHISKCNLDNERLKEEIAANRQRDQFLSRLRWVWA